METATAHDMEKAVEILAELVQEPGVEWPEIQKVWSDLSTRSETAPVVRSGAYALDITGVGIEACARIWATLQGLRICVVEKLDLPHDWERVELDADGSFDLGEHAGAERIRIRKE